MCRCMIDNTFCLLTSLDNTNTDPSFVYYTHPQQNELFYIPSSGLVLIGGQDVMISRVRTSVRNSMKKSNGSRPCFGFGSRAGAVLVKGAIYRRLKKQGL